MHVAQRTDKGYARVNVDREVIGEVRILMQYRDLIEGYLYIYPEILFYILKKEENHEKLGYPH